MMIPDPLSVLVSWRAEAAVAGEPEPDAMALATATPAGAPSVRIVLWRGLSGGRLRFFTNYESRKGRELDDNPQAALCFHFARLGRQVRVEGRVERLPEAESDAYFGARPRGHQLGAWASAQSRRIDSLQEVLDRQEALMAQHEGAPIPRPPYWGGYGLLPERIELWVGRPDRLHERRAFVRAADGWSEHLLSP